MLRSSRSRNFFRKLVVNGVNNSKAAIQNDCLMRLYDADAELKGISSELDSFDGKKDPIRCNLLVNQLRTAQDKVISLLFQLMDDCSCERASRDYRMKFPDEILLSEGSESLNGQIWFGAECLSAGSNILNHTKESTMLRPMAKTLTTHLDSLRNDLRDLVIDGGGASRINQALIKKMVAFDHIFATFEYEYVRTMLPIRTVAEIEKLQEVAVLFSETLIDCVKRNLIKQDDIDEFQPIVMIAIPRLAIVRGLLYKNENPIYTRHKSQMCSLFQPFHGPLHSIKKLLRGLSPVELFSLEKMLANDQSAIESPLAISKPKESTQVADQQNQSIRNVNVETSDTTCETGSEAGTSNNYTNVLMEGLQYPVGNKAVTPECSSYNNQYSTNPNLPEEQNYDCCFASSSSSKNPATTQPQDNLNTAASPSSSSSFSSSPTCKRCDENTVGHKSKDEKHDCDKNCCLSPPENESQLEKLFAEFNSESASEMERPVANLAMTAGANVTNDTSNEHNRSSLAIECTTDDEALLEELFLKQAQQLLHRLFVAISGVADQLQSNFASDLRFILRHIFSSEIEGTDEEDESEDSDNREFANDQSDTSLPIEQGIEAQEVANLIDLGSDYSLNNPYDYDESMRYIPPQAFSHTNSTDINETTRYSPSSSFYAAVVPQSSDSDNMDASRAFQASIEEEGDNRMGSDLAHSNDQSELIYESTVSPNEASIMDANQRRMQLLQQTVQLAYQANTRFPSRNNNNNNTNRNSSQVCDGSSGQTGVERRSRHNHSGSRSRRPRGPPVWVPDQLVVACSCCNSSFTLFRRRHHCRACGQIFCAECSRFTKNLNCWGYNGPVRVCESCYNQP